MDPEKPRAWNPSRRELLTLPVALLPAFVARSARAELLPGPTRAISELERWCKSQGAELGASLVDLATQGEIAGSSSRKPLNPASCQKILTIAAALDRLGPAHRFTTTLHGEPAGDSVADLVLRGDGAPELTTSDLAWLVERIRARGIRRVTGNVLVDQSAFDSAWNPPAYEQRPNDWAAYRAPVSPVAVDGNAVTLNVLPGAEGARATVWLDPPGIGSIQGSITTSPAGRRESVGLTVVPRGGQVLVKVSGSVPSARSASSYARRLENPETAAAHVLKALLERAGIAVLGSAAAGGAGVRFELARAESRPLAQLVHALGKRSDNFCAEMLLKALGRTNTTPGSASAGAAVIEAYLKDRSVFVPGTRIVNGSGLYDASRVCAFTLTRVLTLAYREPRISAELVASLAVGGVDGTLVNRFRAQSSFRNVRAKTGTLANVIALSGYLLGVRPMAFAILINNLKPAQISEARRRIDAALEPLLYPTDPRDG